MRLARRWRVDGGFPPSVERLYRDVAMLRLRDTVAGVIARVMPRRGGAGAGKTARAGWRRWQVAGPIDRSARSLAHLHARSVVEAFTGEGLRPFLVEDGPGLTVGLELSARTAARRAIARVVAEPGWYVQARRGRRTRWVRHPRGTVGARRLAHAASWRVWSMRRSADVVLGDEQAVTVTFWQPGEQSRLERIGVRGQERFAASSLWTREHLEGHSYPGREALPVAHELERFEEPVDVVITWVDGEDPVWRAAFATWSGRAGLAGDRDRAIAPGRYRSRDELRYAMRALWMYAGWVRRIFLVTNGQVPAWLGAHDSVTVVTHDEIFPADWLPVFNSHAIEARLHHVPELAEHFVYFNDDVFAGRPLSPATFFTGNGLPYIFPSDARVTAGSTSEPATLAVDTAAVRGRELIVASHGKVVGFKLHHAPFALRRSLLFELEQELGEQIERTARSRFRHRDDLSIASSLANHHAFATGRAVVGRLAVDYVHLESGRLPLHLEHLRRSRAFDIFCLNETEEPNHDPVAVDRRVARFLEGYFPAPAPWERPGL